MSTVRRTSDWRTLALALVLATAWTSSSQAASARSGGCRGVKGVGTVVRASPQLQLIAGASLEFGEHGLYACARGARRARWLVDQDFLPGPQTLAGSYVAYERLRCNRDRTVCQGSMHVYDARRGRVRNVRTERRSDGSINDALGLLVNARGTAAWLRYADDNQVEVWIWPRDAQPRVVARAADIDTASLAASSSTLYWQAGEQPRAAPLR